MGVTTVSVDKVVYDVHGRPQISYAGGGRGQGRVSTISKGHAATAPSKGRAVQTNPRMDLVTPGSLVAIDCEGVRLLQERGAASCGVGRVSVVNTNGEVIYDTFVYYPEGVPHIPNPPRLKLGVYKKDIKPWNGARAHAEVLAVLKSIFDKSGAIVGHSIHNDMNMLRGIDFSGYDIYDTQKVEEYSHTLKLSALAAIVLGKQIQTEEHSSVEDARATMELWQLHINNPVRTGHDRPSVVAPENLVASLNAMALTPGTDTDHNTSATVTKTSAWPTNVSGIPW